MATVIDSLIVELGLDPTKFTKGQKDAIEAFNKAKEAHRKAAMDMESRTKSATQFFSQLRNQVIGLYAAFTTGRGLKEFVSDITAADAAVGRTSKTLDTTVGILSAWRGAATLVGGTAEGITNSMNGLVQEFQRFSLTGESNVIPYLRALGVNFSDAQGKMKPIGNIMLELADKFQKLDPARAMAFGQAMGFDQGTINMLILGREKVQELLDEQERLGKANAADAAAAQARQKAYNELILTFTEIGRQLLTSVTPALTAVADGLKAISEWAQKHPLVVQAVFAGITAAVIALSTALGILGLVMLATPFGLIIAGFGALVAGVVYLTTHTGVLKSIWNGIVAAFHATPFGMVYDWIMKLVHSLDLLFGIGGKVKSLWQSLFGGGAASPASPSAGGATRAPSARRTAQVPQSDIERLMALGWSREQAAGIAANIQRESGGSATAVGDHGAAFGIAQWHPDRQADFARWAGHDIRSSTRDEQIGFLNYELRSGSRRAAGKALAGATSAGEAAGIVSRLYEGPKDKEGEAALRSALAETLLRAPASVASIGTGAAAASAYSSTSSSSSNSRTEVKIGEINIETKATDAKGIAKEIGPAVERNSFAQQSNLGPS